MKTFSRHNWLFIVAIFLGGFMAASAQADNESTAAPQPVAPAPVEKQADSCALKEIGITFGSPTGINATLGYWGTDDIPVLVRFSGAYYRRSGGLQMDLGWAFDRTGKFRQNLALTLARSFNESGYGYRASPYTTMNSSIGPTYGLNWAGVSFQTGLLVQAKTTQYDLGGPSYTTFSAFVPHLQIGYTLLW